MLPSTFEAQQGRAVMIANLDNNACFMAPTEKNKASAGVVALHFLFFGEMQQLF